jgi:parallel beta-helix repeat protein
VLANIPHPLDFAQPITFWLEPGESIKLTFRVIDTDRDDDITWDPRQDLVVEVEAGAVNWDAETGADPNGPATSAANPPVALDDAYEVQGGDTLEVAAPGVRANDLVFGREVPKATLVTGPAHAVRFDLRSDGSFTYEPDGGFSGTDSFTYFLLGGLRSNVATVTIEVVGDPLVVTNTDDEGFGSLRFAIEYANSHPNPEGVPDTIGFDIRGEEAVYRITPATLLPVVTDPVIIDGTTHPAYDGRPVVIIDGRDLSPEIEGAYGLAITAGRSEVRGLAIVNVPGKGLVLSGGDQNVVRGSWLGLDPDPSVDGPRAGNGEAGIAILDNSDANRIGTNCAPGQPCDAGDANVVSANRGAGIQIYQGSGNAIRGNFIGTDASGSTAYGNGEGVGISGGGKNVIGGQSAADRNVISGNASHGVLMMSVASNVVAGNYIGTNAAGLADLGNGGDGIRLVDSPNNAIGGSKPGERNVVSGNTGEGIGLFGQFSRANRIQGNYVGLSASGAADVGNSASGIYLRRAPGNIVESNIVSGNDGFAGIAICGDLEFCGGQNAGTPSNAAANVVRRNRLGLDAAGTGRMGNAGYGISIDGAPNTAIGGIGQGNYVAASGNAAIVIFKPTATGTVVQGNVIGFDAPGEKPVPNHAGVHILAAASDTLIGGVGGENNVIAFSATTGVLVDGASTVRNRILGNSIFGSGLLNIDLAPAGPTANDRLDLDSGANFLQNHPVITGATLRSGVLRVAGTINTNPGAQVRVEIYRNINGCQPASGGPEVREIIGERTLTTNEAGDGFFFADIAIDPEAFGHGITATATGTLPGFGSNTSEISPCVVILSPIE